MRLSDHTLPTPEENPALDEALLLEAEAGRGGEVLRFWELPSLAVVLGSGGILNDDVRLEDCHADRVPVLRRSSGGGTVLLGRGCLLYSLILSYERDPALKQIHSSYAYISARMSEALSPLVGPIEARGSSDLTFRGRKFSGSSQQRKRRFLLHHGTLLIDFALDLIPRYLKEPPRQPDYREKRPHDLFLTNLPADAQAVREALTHEWDVTEELPEWPRKEVARLVREKYSQREWVHRR